MAQGRLDQVAPGEAAQRFHDSLTAPSKQLVWFERSAHTPHLEEPDKFRDLLKRCGGVRPVLRHRGELRLSLAEREEISRGLAAGLSLPAIAAGLGRAASRVSREVAGNAGRSGIPGPAPREWTRPRWSGPHRAAPCPHHIE